MAIISNSPERITLLLLYYNVDFTLNNEDEITLLQLLHDKSKDNVYILTTY